MCLWLLGSTKMKLQLSSSMRCINNESPTLKLSSADGASRIALTEEIPLRCSMSSLLHRESMRTAAVERVVAPIATHLCHLVLLCDGEEEPEQIGQLEEAAQAVAKATEALAAVASRYGALTVCVCVCVSGCVCVWLQLCLYLHVQCTSNSRVFVSRYVSGTDDEELHVEMSSLLESVAVSGQHVLLAAQKLSIQPALPEHRDELITATQSVFLGVVKVKYEFTLCKCVYKCVVTLLKQAEGGMNVGIYECVTMGTSFHGCITVLP